jgi:hypothetical protein
MLGRELLRVIGPVLQARAITPLPLGDFLYQQTLDTASGRRNVRELRLVVSAANLAPAHAALRGLGFQTSAHATPQQRFTALSPTLPMSLTLGSEPFDTGAFQLDAAGLLARAQHDQRLFGTPVLLPSVLDQLSHLIGQCVSSPSEGAPLDLARIVALHRPDPRALAAHLARHGLARAARFALPLLVQEESAAFCSACLDALPRDPYGALLVRAARRGAWSDLRPHLLSTPFRYDVRLLKQAVAAHKRGERFVPDTTPGELRARVVGLLSDPDAAPVEAERDQLAVLRTAELEAVAGLLHRKLEAQPAHQGPLSVALSAVARRQKQQADAQVAQDRSVLDALSVAGVDCLVLKGAALGHVLYEAPYLRPRIDTDLLVRDRAHAQRAIAALQDLGYTARAGVTGELSATQQMLTRTDPASGGAHVIDLHWRTNNSVVFARSLPFAELWCDAIQIAALGPHARTPCARHALILACVHLAGHETDHEPPLIWLLDIHLLSGQLGVDDWRLVGELAEARGICREVDAALSLVVELFGTQVPSRLRSSLRAGSQRGRSQLEERLVALLPARFERNTRDLCALDTWSERAQLLAEHLLPDADYMKQRYGVASARLLPLLYAHRIGRGIVRALGA